MFKGKQKGIDPVTNSPEPATSPSHKTANMHINAAGTELEYEPDLSIPISSILELACQFYTRDGLHRHLISLGPAKLSNMLLSQVKDDQFRPRPVIPQTPRPAPKQTVKQNSYVKCMCCKKMFDKRQRGGCKVKHFGFLETVGEEGEEKEWTCCGMKVSYTDYDSNFHDDPAEREPYCCIGQHWEEV